MEKINNLLILHLSCILDSLKKGLRRWFVCPNTFSLTYFPLPKPDSPRTVAEIGDFL